MPRTGRPSTYNAKIAEKICNELAIGNSLLKITKRPDFPGEKTVYQWLDQHEDFAQNYARARELQADHYAAEIIDLADTPVQGKKTVIKSDGSKETIHCDQVDRTRLQVDARKWYASKLAPKKYGDYKSIRHSGGVTLASLVCGEDVVDKADEDANDNGN